MGNPKSESKDGAHAAQKGNGTSLSIADEIDLPVGDLETCVNDLTQTLRRLVGQVAVIAKTPSQQDWFAAGVKLYHTRLTLSGELPALKPGMTAEVTFLRNDGTRLSRNSNDGADEAVR